MWRVLLFFSPCFLCAALLGLERQEVGHSEASTKGRNVWNNAVQLLERAHAAGATCCEKGAALNNGTDWVEVTAVPWQRDVLDCDRSAWWAFIRERSSLMSCLMCSQRFSLCSRPATWNGRKGEPKKKAHTAARQGGRTRPLPSSWGGTPGR